MNKNAAFLALDAFAHSGPTLAQALIDAGYTTREDARPVVVEWAAKRARCPLVESSHHLSKTAFILDASSPKFSAASKAVQRVMDVLQGEKRVSNKKEAAEPVVIAKKTVAAFEAQVLALGLTKAELRVLFAQTLDGLR